MAADVKFYRIAKNSWNVQDPPWSGAIGIEELLLQDGEEVFAVPPLICWFTRGEDHKALADLVVTLLNKSQVSLKGGPLK